MGYVYNAASVRDLMVATTSSTVSWLDALASVRQGATYIATGDLMAGEEAQNLISYLQQVHLNSICGALSSTLADLNEVCRQYYTKYIARVSDKCDELIDTDELDTVQRALKDIYYHINQVESDMKAVMHSISGATKQSYSGLSAEIPAQFSTAFKQLDNLINSIGAIEGESTKELAGIEAAVASIRRVIYDSCSSEVSITEFSVNEFLSSKGFSALFAAMKVVAAQYSDIVGRTEEIDGLIAGVEEQWEQRERIATVAKIGLAAIEMVAIAAAVVIPPLSVVGAVCIGVAAGAFNGAISEGIDQWASGEKAIKGGFNFDTIVYEGAKGGFKGGLKAGIGYIVAPISPNLKGVGKLALDSGTNLIENFATYPFELLDSVAEEEDFDSAWERITSKEYARETVVKSVVSAGVDCVAEQLGSNISDKIPDSEKAFMRYGKKFISDGLENLASKTGEEITDSAIEALIPDDVTYAAEQRASLFEQLEAIDHRMAREVVPSSIDSLVSSIKNPGKLISHFVSGGTAGAVIDAFEDRQGYRDSVNQAIQKDNRLRVGTGSYYSSYMQSYTGEHIAFDSDGIEVLLLDSDPDLAVMKEIAGDCVYPTKTVVKSASKLMEIDNDEKQAHVNAFVGFDFSHKPIVQP